MQKHENIPEIQFPITEPFFLLQSKKPEYWKNKKQDLI